MSDDGRHGRATAALRVGVTGHRAIVDEAGVAGGVDEALDGLMARAATDDVVLVSALAEGADRIAARRVLARGGRLEAVLPLEPGDYAADFPASVADFRALLAAAVRVTVCAGAPTRDDAYLAAGEAMLGASDALVAVWSGRPANGKGGTAEIVARARADGRPIAWVRAANGAEAPLPGPAVVFEGGG